MYLLLALLLPFAAYAEGPLLNTYRLEQIGKVQTERRQQLQEDYAHDLEAAATPEARNAIQQRYQTQLNPNTSLGNASQPLEQRMKLYRKELETTDNKLDYWREGDISTTVDTLNSEAAYSKGIESFRTDQSDNVLDAVFDARTEQLKTRGESLR
ncbi:MAG: hypothetical protein H6922_03200 [Pseudomonadaceae bacterium]|nr:hypothetical protein [Pseudomonadaceae bacterium]